MVSIWFSFALDVSAFLAFFFLRTSASCIVHGTWTVQVGKWTVTRAWTETFLLFFLLFSIFNFQQNKSSQLMFSLRPYLSQHKNHLKVIVNLYSWYNQDKNSSIYRWNCMPCSNISSHRACLYNMHYLYRPWENQSTYQFIWFIQWA